MLAANQLLQDRYRIVRQLGHGGMGAVYEAIDERFGAPIALKEIIIDSIGEKQRNVILQAFEREAKSLARIRHEAVPFVRDYFSESNRQFLVMELIEGDDLAERLAKRQAPFALNDALKWLDQLLDTLDYLHSLAPPIIHRDIKPQNLKLTARRKIKLLDFGIIKDSEAAATRSNHTFMGATLGYSPIEQILRVIEPTYREFILLKYRSEAEAILAQSTDRRSDIYSLGATFYHLLTNREPIDAPKRALELWSGNPEPLENPSVLNPNIPPLVSACLLKAMEIERADRFSSALEMREALQQAAAAKSFSMAASGVQTEVITAESRAVQNRQTSSQQTTIAYQAENLPFVKSKTGKSFFSSKTLWFLPLVTVVAVVALLLINSGRQSEMPAKSIIPNSPTVSPSAFPTNETIALPEASPTLSPSRSMEEVNKSTKTPISVPATNKTPKPAAIKKPVQASPKPAEDPNCVFTNSCR